MADESPFLAIPEHEHIAANELAFAIRDAFPVSPGHALVVTRRVVATWFEATAAERAAVMALVDEVQRWHRHAFDPPPDGWNVGFNAGTAAGQTVMHLHVHVIPRWHGDTPSPRGGVRHCIPGKGDYLAGGDDADLCVGHPDDPFLERLLAELPAARAVDIVAAFAQAGGLDVLEAPLVAAMACGASVRVLVGDYLGVTDPEALQRLLQLSRLSDPAWPPQAGCAVRFVLTERLPGRPASFHPKAWRIARADGSTVAWVGSSNLSLSALCGGVEWNLRVGSWHRPQAVAAVERAFERLWRQAQPLDAAQIAAYATQRSAPAEAAAAASVPRLRQAAAALEVAASESSFVPRPWQEAALAALDELRRRGQRRALACVATGLGKTVLAALDIARLGLGRDGRRVIAIAHRAEILMQISATLRRVLGRALGRVGWCLGDADDLEGDLVLASVPKLARPEMLTRLAEQHFAYAILDEVHHAEAPTWRRVLAALRADFVLGLTATPERADGRHVAALFDDCIACEVSIGDGIAEGSLVPFAYYGIPDDTDYQPIPWRNGAFDPEALERALCAGAQFASLWRAWHRHPGRRTLVFCASVRHAAFVRDGLQRQGVPAAAVWAGPGSDDRGAALRALAEGRLAALCAVDLFNEGIDIPCIDRIVLLRPTASPVLFMQQLGRGLRTHPDKTRLVVLDLVGNHRVFLWRIQHLGALCGIKGEEAVRAWLAGRPAGLPPGCSVELTAVGDVLRRWLRQGDGVELYRVLRERWGRRPSAAELAHRGVALAALRACHDHWFALVAAEGDLDPPGRRVLERHGAWLRFVATTALNKSWKMVVLAVLLEHGALCDGMPLAELAERCRRRLLDDPLLRHDLAPNRDIPDHATADPEAWAAWWRRWPIAHLAPWVVVDADGRVRVPELRPEPELAQRLAEMTAELVEGRLADYLQRAWRRLPDTVPLLVSHQQGRPVLRVVADDAALSPLSGPLTARLADGRAWCLRFVGGLCRVAYPAEGDGTLTELLAAWFGADAGRPDRELRLRLSRHGGTWTLEPEPAPPAHPAPVSRTRGRPAGLRREPPPGEGGWVPVLDLAAAASGFSDFQAVEPLGWLRLPQATARQAFVAQVRGCSMEPTIPDGAWCLFRAPVVGSRDGRVLLVQHRQISDPEHGGRYTVKRYRSRKIAAGDAWRHAAIELHPDNPAFAPIVIHPHQADDLRIIAAFVRVVEAPEG